MKQFAIALAALTLSAGSALADDSPFAGNWKLNLQKSQFTGDTFSYTATSTGFKFSNGATVSYDFAIDGKPYPMLADRTTTWTKTPDGGWDTTVKVGDIVLNKSHRTLSADGKKLTMSFTQYKPDGTTSSETDVYERVSGGPGLAGVWRDVQANAASQMLSIATPAPGNFVLSYPSYKQTVSGSTDGGLAPVTGPTVPPGMMASYTADGPNKWNYSISLKDKVYEKGVMTVSADHKTLTDKNWIPGKESEASIAVYDKQ
jgi:hypothetical protein